MTDQNNNAEPQTEVGAHRPDRASDPPLRGKRASIRFVVVFVLLVTVFYVPYAFISQRDEYKSTYLSLIAKSASAVLCVLGQDTEAIGPFIRSPLRPASTLPKKRTSPSDRPIQSRGGKKTEAMRKRGGVIGGTATWTRALTFEIVPGCDGTEGFALFGSAVLASPFLLRARLVFLVVGSLVLFVVNTLRIVTLFMLGIYWPDVFHSAHMDLWPGFIIVAVLVCWLSWARWMMRKQSGVPNEWG